MYKLVWWAMGHSSQQINVSAHVSLWYLIRGAAARRQAAERESQPHRLPHVHPVPATRFRAPPAGRAGPGCELEDRQHQLHDVPGGAGIDGSRPDRAGRDRGGAAPERLQPRACSSGCARRHGGIRPSPPCSCRWSCFGFIGGISGVVLGTEQLNVLMHNTIYVPGHFHGTVVAGTTLAFMARDLSRAAADLRARDHVAEAWRGSSPICSASAPPASRCS